MEYNQEVSRRNAAERDHSARTVQVMLLVVLAAALGFLLGVWFTNRNDSPHNDEDFKIFWQTWDVLDREYYYGLEADPVLVRGAIQGLLATTGDRYTFLVPPRQAEFDRQATAGEFGGIGAYVSQNAQGQLTISMPFNGFPAEQAGLLAGDIVLAVDGASIEGWALDDAVALLRGEVGSRVALTVLRPSEARQFEVTITRARVELPTTYATRFGEVGYLRLFSFNGRAATALQTDLEKLLGEGVTALILDLRGNPGGLLDQAVAVSDLFLREGLVLTQRNRQGREVHYQSQDGQIGEEIPLVVLIDEGSASASEVVAGALRDRDRAVLIGHNSFGKGLVQHVYDLADGSQLHVTVSLWFTPDGTPIHGEGLTPGIAVEGAASMDPSQDAYVLTAIQYFADQGIRAELPAVAVETEPAPDTEG